MSFSDATQKLIDGALQARELRDQSAARAVTDATNTTLPAWAKAASKEHAAVDDRALAQAIGAAQAAMAAEFHAKPQEPTPSHVAEPPPATKPVPEKRK